MKAQALQWPDNPASKEHGRSRPINANTVNPLISLLMAAVPVAVISVLALWLISAGGIAFVAAASWAAAFLLFALAIDSDGRKATSLAISGFVLIVLAVLGANVAPEFGVLAGFVQGSWIAAPIISRQSALIRASE